MRDLWSNHWPTETLLPPCRARSAWRHQRVQEGELPRRLDETAAASSATVYDGKATKITTRGRSGRSPRRMRGRSRAPRTKRPVDDRGDEPGRPAARLLEVDQDRCRAHRSRSPRRTRRTKAGEDDLASRRRVGHRLDDERLTCGNAAPAPPVISRLSSVEPSPRRPSCRFASCTPRWACRTA